MKKVICLCLLSAFLCGCGTVREEIAQSQIPQEIEVSETVASIVERTYVDERDFHCSEYCGQLRSKGYIPFSLCYDTGKYEMLGMIVDEEWYAFALQEKQSGNTVQCRVQYTDAESREEFFKTMDGERMTAQNRSGCNFDVCVVNRGTEEQPEYELYYLPYANVSMCIATCRETPEEVIEDFKDFVLDAPEVSADIVIHTFDTAEEFLASEAAEEMREFGCSPYRIAFDEDRYEVDGAVTDGGWYQYSIRNREDDSRIGCDIWYCDNHIAQEDGSVDVRYFTEGDSFVTLEKNGVEYDVYVARVLSAGEPRYNLFYTAAEHTALSLMGYWKTPETALEYFQEFDLISAEN